MDFFFFFLIQIFIFLDDYLLGYKWNLEKKIYKRARFIISISISV